MNDTAITFRTNKETKAAAQKIFAELGMDISTALNVYLRKVIHTESIPFEVSVSEEFNEETLAVIREAIEHPENLNGPYKTKKELFEALYA